MTAAKPPSRPARPLELDQLFDAARRGDAVELAKAFDGGASPDATNENGDTLVMLAAYHGHVEAVKLLVQRGADPNRLNNRQ
ncbi:ANK_REP_REGION domain-containing protein [Rhodotorula toruloides]|nr:ANK_REP_REGION domain-containing protein [Rhodotorula toruloides]